MRTPFVLLGAALATALLQPLPASAAPAVFVSPPTVRFGAPWSEDPSVTLFADPNPTLEATVDDPDTTRVEVCLVVETELGGEYTPVAPPVCGSAFGPGPDTVRVVLRDALSGDGLYYLRATADDGAIVMDSARVPILLDSTPPAVPELSVTAPAGGWVQGGAPGTVTITGPPDAVEFAWSLPFGNPGLYCGPGSPFSRVPAVPVGDATTATMPVTSRLAGPSTLSVVSCDEAHNRSGYATADFVTGTPRATHVWTFADDPDAPGRDTGLEATDSSRIVDRLGAGRGPGRGPAPDRSLLLTGAGYGRTRGSVDLVPDAGGFSVMAWVSGAHGRRAAGTILAQRGEVTDAVRLLVEADRYRMVVRAADDTMSAAARVTLGFSGSGCTPSATRWCLVVGTWQQDTRTLSLSSFDPQRVEEARAVAEPRPEVLPFAGTGPFRAGVSRVDGRGGRWFSGRIDQIRLYDGVLRDSDIRVLGFEPG